MNIYNITISEIHASATIKMYTTEAKSIRGAIANLREFFRSKFIKENESEFYINNYEGIKAHVVKGDHIIGENI